MLTTEHQLALKLACAAGEIVHGHRSCRTAFASLCTPAAIEYVKRRRIYGLTAAGKDDPDPLLSLYRKVWGVQRQAVLSLVKSFNEAEIDLLVFKGAELTERHCQSTPIALRGDIDLVVRREQLPQTKQLFQEQGFIQANYDNVNCRLVPIDQVKVAEYESDRYTLPSFARLCEIELSPAEAELQPSYMRPLSIRKGRGVVVVAFDVAVGLDKQIDAASLFQSSTESVFAGARTVRPEDNLWYTATLFYLGTYLYREENKLSSLADLAVQLSAAATSRFDWDYLIARAEAMELLPSLYYPLSLVNEMSLEPIVPAAVLTSLRPSRGARARDYGWQIHKLFGLVEPFPQDLGLTSHT